MGSNLRYWSIDPTVTSCFATSTVSDLTLYNNSYEDITRHVQQNLAVELATEMFKQKQTDYCVIVEPPHPRESIFSTDFTVIGIPGEYARLKAKIEDLERALMIERSRNSMNMLDFRAS
jgi:hypothetical protein